MKTFLARNSKWLLPLIPLLILSLAYGKIVNDRRAANPNDRLLPTPTEVWKAAVYSVTEDEFTYEIPLKEDITASLKLFAYGYLTAVALALVTGLAIGYWKPVCEMWEPWLKAMSYVPPMSLLTLIFLSLGIGTLAKSFLIFLAVYIPLARSTVLHIQAINDHRIWNAKTLGPTHLEMIWIVIRRTIEPQFLDDARGLIGIAWVYLISAELIASDSGIGYRINIASRNTDIAQIALYVFVIGLIAFIMDKAMLYLNRTKNRWAFKE
jgi:NitT/TauT family transport system permease protein